MPLLIPTTPEAVKPAAKIVAESMIDGMNNALKSRLDSRAALWRTTWENPRATPQEIVAAMGASAAIIFASAGLEAEMLAKVAAVRGVELSELIGADNVKTLSVPAGWAATLNQDGTVTLTAP